MDQAISTPYPPREPSAVATVTRLFGWCMLVMLAVWLLNTVLTLSYGWPGVASLFRDGFSAGAVFQLALYVVGFAAAILWSKARSTRPLRRDSDQVSAFNAWLVRAAFFAVLFVGIGDSIISFLRIEEMLTQMFGHDLASKLGRSNFRGTYVHFPLMVFGLLVASATRTLGFIWLTLLIVVAELLIVISRFIFSYEQAFMGDLVRFWYAALFLFASAYTLIEEGHVRVDVFYASMRQRTKGIVNTLGTLFFGMSLCWTILIVGLGSRTSIIYSPIRSFETSQSSYGLYVKYLMAGFLAVFAVTMLIQFVSYLFSAVADTLDEPGHVEHEGASAS